MRIRHLRNTPLPDTGDSTRVQPSDWNADHVCDVDIITENTTFVVNPTGNNASFSTLAECFAHVNSLIFKPDVRLDISLSAGIHNVNASVADTNPHRRVHIYGPSPEVMTFTDAVVSGMPGTRQVTYTVSNQISPDVIVGTVLVFHNYGSPSEDYIGHFGAHIVIDVSGQDITVLNTNLGDVLPFTSTAFSGHVLTCVIRANNSLTSVMDVIGSCKGDYDTPYLENLAINGNGTSGFAFRARHGSKIACTGATDSYSVALLNSSINMLAEDSSSIMFGSSGVVSSSCATGFLSSRGSLIDLSTYPIICSSSNSGVGASVASDAISHSGILVDNHYDAAAGQFGRISWSISYFRTITANQMVDGTSFIG